MNVIARPRALRAQVKEQLVRRIVAGVYAPGERIVETRIAQEFGVSQATVREALRELEPAGLIVHEPHRGCSVRAPSDAELLGAFPVRAALESLAARLAAERIDEATLARLVTLVDDMRAAGRAGDSFAQAQANADFHATIVAAADNGTLTRQWIQLEPLARTFVTSARLAPAGLPALAERHVPIVAALAAHDGAAAAAAMETHLHDAAADLRRAMEA